MTRNLEIQVVDFDAAGAKFLGIFGVEVISGTPKGSSVKARNSTEFM